MRGPQNFLLFLRGPQIIFLVILKNILGLDQWTSRNQEFRQWTNGKQLGPQRNSEDISPRNITCFHINYVGNNNDGIS